MGLSRSPQRRGVPSQCSSNVVLVLTVSHEALQFFLELLEPPQFHSVCLFTVSWGKAEHRSARIAVDTVLEGVLPCVVTPYPH